MAILLHASLVVTSWWPWLQSFEDLAESGAPHNMLMQSV